MDLWQVETNFYFRRADGYLGLTPPLPKSYSEWPITRALYRIKEIPDSTLQMGAFLVNKHVNEVVMPNGGARIWRWNCARGPCVQELRPFTADERRILKSFFSPFDPKPIHVADVTIYRIPLDRLTEYRTISPVELQADLANKQIRTLIVAANRYLNDRLPMERLSLLAAERLDLIPRLWLTNSESLGFAIDSTDIYGLSLGIDRSGDVRVAIRGSLSALGRLQHDYSPYCTRVKIDGPSADANLAEWTLSTLTLDFDRVGLAKAAAYAARQESSAAAKTPEAPEKGAFAGASD